MAYRNRRGASFVAIALGSTTLLLSACSEDTNIVRPAGKTTTAEEVAENTEALMGDRVTVRGSVVERLNNFTFTISDGRFFGGEEIMVVNTSGAPFDLPESGDVEVQVTGEVREFKAFDFDRFDLTEIVEPAYQEMPTIVAESIVLAPAPAELSDSPALYYSQTVATEGNIEEVRGFNTFTLDGGNLLVLNVSDSQLAVREDEKVILVGEIRPFGVVEIEQDYDTEWDENLRWELEQEFSNRPLFVATKIYPAPEE